MSLNPVQFGTQVIDQFGRYLLSQYPIADKDLEAQIKSRLRHGSASSSLIHKGPFVHLSSPFEPGPSTKDLVADPALGLHPHLARVFPFEAIHKHQEIALRSVRAGKHTVMATGTGSGKTEGFLMPIVDHCLKRRDAAATQEDAAGVVAVLVYPMNALVNDQLERMRPLLAGTRITFGRYTGETDQRADDTIKRLDHPRPYTADERHKMAGDGKRAPERIIPWEECFTRDEIIRRRPNLLLTNYTMLEYMLLRDRDLELLRGAPLQFFVFDEVHTYTGALGSEVACLVRRLRAVANKGVDDVICIGTSATVTDQRDSAIDGVNAIQSFCHRLFGVDKDKVELVTEQYAQLVRPNDPYTPPLPSDMGDLLIAVLDAARTPHLQEAVEDIPDDLLALAERLCGRNAAPDGSNPHRLYRLLEANRVVWELTDWFRSPRLFDDAIQGLVRLGNGRQLAEAETLRQEMLAYLTLGALAFQDEEPLLRPKLHYFVQGYQGLTISFESTGPQLHLDIKGEDTKADGTPYPLLLCRACGQHYVRLIAEPEEASDDGRSGHRKTRIPEPYEEPKGEDSWLTFTNVLHSQFDDAEKSASDRLVCRMCGTVHGLDHQGACQGCGALAEKSLIRVLVWEGHMSQCPACGTYDRGGKDFRRTQTIIPARSRDVGDVTILAQSMLSAMPEEKLRKLLIFADNRQDAAFQAGWMEERGKRFRMRHLLYQLLHEEAQDRPLRFERLVERLLDRAMDEDILPQKAHGDTADEETKVRWFLDEEFASMAQRRRSLEALGLAEVVYDGLEANADITFFTGWSQRLEMAAEEIVSLTRLLLDVYRSSGAMSDALLNRWWGDQDKEVRRGLISTAFWQAPQVVVLEKSEEQTKSKNRLVKGVLASNGRSFAQVLVGKAAPEVQSKDRDEFLAELWEWLIDRQLIVPVQILQRQQKRIVSIAIDGGPHQVNVERIGVREASTRCLCSACNRSHSADIPTKACPEYLCKGRTIETGRDEENYDVVQFTRTAFVPMRCYEHSAQVPKTTRDKVEKGFKSESGSFNTIVATPTLEMGVDIGKLEMVLMRNVPPTPANYAQRAGRAGRKHRLAVVFNYCRGGQHDRYFFEDPPAMIAGDIRVPSFSMRNEPLIRKHVRSAILTMLRELAAEESDQETLAKAFPTYLWQWLGNKVEEGDAVRFFHHTQPKQFSKLRDLLRTHDPIILSKLGDVFQSAWPESERESVCESVLRSALEAFSDDLGRITTSLFNEVAAYRRARDEMVRKQLDGLELTKEEQARLRQYNNVLLSFQDQDQAHYSISWLCQHGFFPGYALTRESVAAQCLEPYIDLTRPAAVALRELTPGASVYANKQIFTVRKMTFNRLKVHDGEDRAESIKRLLRYDEGNDRIYDPTLALTEGGDSDHREFDSYQIVDVELRHNSEIDDTSDFRRQVAYVIHGMLLPRHQGGYEAKVGEWTLRHLKRAEVRLVNLGPMAKVKAEPSIIGFPVCPQCGETRNPFATDREMENFSSLHKERCLANVTLTAVHVDIESDVIEIGPFLEKSEAINLAEGLRLGCRMILDMGDSELEAFINTDGDGQHWVVFYDPVPGGTGFLTQLVEYWPEIVTSGIQVLSNCPGGNSCDTACYRCMKHFRNQQHHTALNRHEAVTLLSQMQSVVERRNDLPPWKPMGSVPDEQQTDSDSEWDFIRELEKHHFRTPDAQQYRVNLPGGSYTVADYAYTEERVLVFIDGLSMSLHGDPIQAQKDKLNRQKARMIGYKVVEYAAEAVRDQAGLSLLMQELEMMLVEQ